MTRHLKRGAMHEYDVGRVREGETAVEPATREAAAGRRGIIVGLNEDTPARSRSCGLVAAS